MKRYIYFILQSSLAIAMKIFVDRLNQTPIELQKIEIVERKGLGHPDHVCDSTMNYVSTELNKAYLEKAGTILHYNVDKSLLVAGETEPRFGGGLVKRPMLLVFGDRATFEANGVEIPVKEIAIRAAKEWIRKNLRFVDSEEHVRYQVELKPGSPELVDIFKRGGRVLCANDTSAAVGYAPMSRLEKLILSVERYVNSPNFKRKYPESGEDVKVMGLRLKDEVHLTMATSFVDRFIKDEEDYFKKKEEVLDEVYQFVKDSGFKSASIELNTLDVRGRGLGGVYLTVLGTSAESGDSGQVGRGNRVNGVIPLNRPLCSEAAAGKNPVSHVGKIYNVLTHRIAERIYEEVPSFEEVYVWLLGQIGRPIDQPTVASAQVIMKKGKSFEGVKKDVERIIDEELKNIDKFCIELARGEIMIC